MIGSNIVRATIEKPEKLADAAWFSSALDNLNTYSLGEEWSKLVEKWALLERLMGQGKIGKVCRDDLSKKKCTDS